MTHTELRDDLITRIGFRDEGTIAVSVIAPNTTTDSGRYFQDEHSFVTVQNLYSCMEKNQADETEFNAYLTRLKERAIILVLADIFEVEEIADDILEYHPTLFDNAISKRMAIVIGEEILTSTRSNKIQRITDEFLQHMFFEINGNSDSSGAEPNPNFPTYVGIKSRYGQEINRIKETLGQTEKLDVFSMRTIADSLDDTYIL